MSRSSSAKTLVLGAVLTALVVLLQYMGSFVRFGPFSISLVLIPIVIGAATCGPAIATWLGFVFGVVVLLSGDAAAFLAVTVPGTVVTVLSKGILCGLCAALSYKGALKLFSKFSPENGKYFAVVVSAVVCPVVNTGVFLICCMIFFLDTLTQWAGGSSVAHYMIFVLVGGNFIFEMISNIVLSPVAARLINIRNKT